MHQLVPLLKEKLSPVINMLIPALVDNNLNSKNPGIYAAATSVIQALCQHLGEEERKGWKRNSLLIGGRASGEMISLCHPSFRSLLMQCWHAPACFCAARGRVVLQTTLFIICVSGLWPVLKLHTVKGGKTLKTLLSNFSPSGGGVVETRIPEAFGVM